MKCIATFLACLFCWNSLCATPYYVDSRTGNDHNNGLAPATAWQSLKNVNTHPFQPNDSILFARGGVWRGQLVPQSGSPAGYITYSAYGNGDKPLLLGSVNKSTPADWVAEGKNTWRCTATFTTDIGNVIFNKATAFGRKKWNLASLTKPGDYWYNLRKGTLHLYATANPATVYTDIELAQRLHIVNYQNVSYAVFENLALKYGAAHGFGGANTQHITIRACEISYIGGGDLKQDGKSQIRFGNGVEFWANAHDNRVEQCRIWEIYDTGVTNQSQGNGVKQYRIAYRFNTIYNCALASFEYWNKSPKTYTGDIRFEHNVCVGAGKGWGTQRPDRVGAHVLLSYNKATTDSIVIRNNIFHTAHACLAMPASWKTTDGYTRLLLETNCYYQPQPTDTLVFLFPATVYQTTTFATYQSATQHDARSVVANPLFIDEQQADFRLRPASPCPCRL